MTRHTTGPIQVRLVGTAEYGGTHGPVLRVVPVVRRAGPPRDPSVVRCDVRLAQAEASHHLARRHNARPVHTMVSAPRPVRPARERRRQSMRRVLLVVAIGIGIALGTVAALMPQSLRHAFEAPASMPTAQAWAADASGCLTNTITGAVACPVVEGE